MNKICIISNSLKDKDLQIGKDISARFLALAASEGIEGAEAPLLDICDVYLDVPSGMQGFIVIGGDGSVLSAAKKTLIWVRWAILQRWSLPNRRRLCISFFMISIR